MRLNSFQLPFGVIDHRMESPVQSQRAVSSAVGSAIYNGTEAQLFFVEYRGYSQNPEADHAEGHRAQEEGAVGGDRECFQAHDRGDDHQGPELPGTCLWLTR